MKKITKDDKNILNWKKQKTKYSQFYNCYPLGKSYSKNSLSKISFQYANHGPLEMSPSKTKNIFCAQKWISLIFSKNVKFLIRKIFRNNLLTFNIITQCIVMV